MSIASIDARRLAPPILILFGLLVVANGVFFFTTTRPAVRKQRALIDSSSPQAEMVRDQEKVVENLEGFVAAVKQAQTDMSVLRDDVLSTADQRLIDTLAELDALCDQFNIPWERLNFDTDILGQEELVRFSMLVPLEGNYADLRRFLQAVESSERFLVVERISLAQGGPDQRGLQLDISLTTYFNATPEQLIRLKALDPRSFRGGQGA